LPDTAASNSSKQSADTVTFSSTARERESAAQHAHFGALSVAAHQDPALADQLAYEYAHTEQTPLYDVTDIDKGIVRYSNTGEIVTPESEARYQQLGKSLQSASLNLYDAEKAKGTDPADIYDELIALGNGQPADFRTVVNWETQTA
jgi:hypothetical protein